MSAVLTSSWNGTHGGMMAKVSCSSREEVVCCGGEERPDSLRDSNDVEGVVPPPSPSATVFLSSEHSCLSITHRIGIDGRPVKRKEMHPLLEPLLNYKFSYESFDKCGILQHREMEGLSPTLGDWTGDAAENREVLSRYFLALKPNPWIWCHISSSLPGNCHLNETRG